MSKDYLALSVYTLSRAILFTELNCQGYRSVNVKNIHRSDCKPENTSEFFEIVLGSGFQPFSEFVVVFLSAYDKADHILIIFTSL